MFCSGCGQGIAQGQAVCPQCGRPAAATVPPPIPNMAFELANYANRVRALSTVWFIYSGISLLTGVLGLAFAHSFLNGNGFWMNGPWTHGNFPLGREFGSGILHFAWIMLLLRSGLAFVAGWGLMERAPWGRVVAIVASFLSLLKIPFGTALAIWTLVSLLGYRNATLYDQF